MKHVLNVGTLFTFGPGKVLMALQNIPCPAPVQAAQAEPDHEVVKPKKKVAKKKKTQESASSKPAPVPDVLNEKSTSMVYEPGTFRKTFLEFIRKEKDQNGSSHQEALESWRNSDLKASLLENMPTPEKRKRRFG